jgi:hypothetical protein
MPNGVDALSRLTVTYVYKGVNCLNSFWARSKPADPLTTFQQVTDKLILDYEIGVMGRMKQLMTTDTQFIGAVATMLNPLASAQSVKSYTTDFGQVAGDGLPPHDAGVLSLYTGYPGRRVHGRLYLGGVPESMTTGGELTAAYLTAMKNLGDWLIGQFGDAGTSPNYWWGVYSRANGRTRQPGPPPYFSYSPLTLIPWKRHVTNIRIGTQRHRKLGRGI